MKRVTAATLVEDQAARRPVVLATWLATGAQQLVHPTSDAPASPLMDAARDALTSDRAAVVEIAGDEVFVQPFAPPLRLIIIGAGHIAQELAPLAQRLELEVTVIDPRDAFATRARFPDAAVALVTTWPRKALAAMDLDARTAVVTCTHDAKIDDQALAHALSTSPFYIGALGSRRTHAARCQRLLEGGAAEAALARIHAPVGLDIGARTPAEIALSVVAEIIATWHGEAK